MRLSEWLRSGMAVAALISAMNPATGKGPQRVQAQESLAGEARDVGCSPRDLMRRIEDPGSGTHWLLFRDEKHLGGPGRLVQETTSGINGCASGPARSAMDKCPEVRPRIIRAGDRLIVREQKPSVDLQLQGVALASAVAGSVLNVRLVVGGKTVRAIAAQPGKAWLLTVTGPMQ
jgi:hypothetical protein